MMQELSAGCLLAVCAVVASYFSNIVPEPYMDEIFHIPQAQRYCSSNLSYWDPMITTPPGLYFTTILWVYPVSAVLGRRSATDLCTTTFLRAQNMVFGVLLYIVLLHLIKEVQGKGSAFLCILHALTLALFPVQFFFYFLYYTDAGATFLVLLGYLLASRNRHKMAAMTKASLFALDHFRSGSHNLKVSYYLWSSGSKHLFSIHYSTKEIELKVLLWSLCYRQTSIVWLMFVAGTTAIRAIETSPQVAKGRKGLSPQTILDALLSNFPSLFLLLWPYFLVASIFTLAVYLNGSVSLGDKTHHTVSLHFPQALYFAGFTCVFSAPTLLFELREMSGLALKRKKLLMGIFVMLVVIMGAAVHFFTYVHPYLLADNRHYPFYLWKNIFRRNEYIKYLLVPFYAVATLCLILSLVTSGNSPLWILCYTLSCCLVLIPPKLIEFRYFIIPFLIFQIHSLKGHQGHLTLSSLCSVLGELIFFGALNTVTIWLFLFRPFKWPDIEEEWQRFMW